MYQLKLQSYTYYQLFVKNILVICLFISPCLFAGELANSSSVARLIYQDKNGIDHSAPLLKSSVVMHVNGLINRVTVKQIFENNSKQWINATYQFPLPENAAVDHLQIVLDQRVIVGEIKEKLIAKKMYAKAKQQGKKAALVEQQRNDIFSSGVANIAPGERVQVEIEYQQSVNYKLGVFSLRYPLTITPRYAPQVAPLNLVKRMNYLNCLTDSEISPEESVLCENKWDNWQQNLESHLLAQETNQNIKDRNDPDLLVDIDVYLNSPLAIKNITSPYHKIKIERQNYSSQLVLLQDDSVIANRDFVLNWQLEQTEESETALFVEDKDAEKYAALMILPPDEKFINSARINKEVIFVIDTSGSMSGTSITQAKSALNFAIEQLGENDTFNIIAFSDRSEFFASNSLPVDKRSKAMAKVFIDQLEACGGTNMESALTASLMGHRTVNANKKQGLRQVVFITDASISNEQQLLTQIKQDLGESRLFMVGIGSAPNYYFMKSSVKMGKGTFTYIGDINEVERKMSALFTQLSTPVLRDIKIQWADGGDLEYWPKPASDLYQGEPLLVSFKIPKDKKALHISGVRFVDNHAQPWGQNISLTDHKNAQGVAILWAKTQIDSLDLQRDLSAIEKQNKITELGLKFHIVTNYTSLIAVEQKTDRPDTANSVDKQIKTHLPTGNTMRLPQTGLASELYEYIGLLILLLAALLWVGELYYQQLRCANRRL